MNTTERKLFENIDWKPIERILTPYSIMLLININGVIFAGNLISLMSIFCTAYMILSIYRYFKNHPRNSTIHLLLELKVITRNKGSSTSARKQKRGKPRRGIREHMQGRMGNCKVTGILERPAPAQPKINFLSSQKKEERVHLFLHNHNFWY